MPAWLSSKLVFTLIVDISAVVGGLMMLWALIGHRAKGRPRCYRCLYDMTAATSLTCPECGHTAPDEKQLFKTRRRWKTTVVSCLLLCLSSYVWFWPGVSYRLRYSPEAWYTATIPTSLIIAFVPWCNESTYTLVSSRIGVQVAPFPASSFFVSGESLSFVSNWIPSPRGISQQLLPWQKRLLLQSCKNIFTNEAVPDNLRQHAAYWVANLAIESDEALKLLETNCGNNPPFPIPSHNATADTVSFTHLVLLYARSPTEEKFEQSLQRVLNKMSDANRDSWQWVLDTDRYSRELRKKIADEN